MDFMSKVVRENRNVLLLLVIIVALPLTAFTYAQDEDIALVSIHDGDEVRVCYTSLATVHELLQDQGISLDYNDFTIPALTASLEADMEIMVNRVESYEITEQVTFDREPRRIKSSRLPVGRQIVIREGNTGIREVVEQVVKINGQVALVRELQSRTISAATRGTMLTGVSTRPRPMSTRPGQRIKLVATAYSPDARSCGADADGFTCLGLRAGYGIAAVDKNVIPMGTRLYVEGYGYALAADVGGAIKGNRIDLCFDTHQEAMRFGRRVLNVYILD